MAPAFHSRLIASASASPGWLAAAAGGRKSWHGLSPALVSLGEGVLSASGTGVSLSSCDSGFGDIYRMIVLAMLRGCWPGAHIALVFI